MKTDRKAVNALINVLVVVALAWWSVKNWDDIKAGARDGWAEAAFTTQASR